MYKDVRVWNYSEILIATLQPILDFDTMSTQGCHLSSLSLALDDIYANSFGGLHRNNTTISHITVSKIKKRCLSILLTF